MSDERSSVLLVLSCSGRHRRMVASALCERNPLGLGTAEFQRPTLALRERETEGGGQDQTGCGS
jgi:hypothetical protein